MSEKTALVFLAPGSEEMEVVITVDILRRAGIEVSLAGFCDAVTVVKCSRGVNIQPDMLISQAKGPYDVMVLPGGVGGSQSLAKSKQVGELLRKQDKDGKWIAAICAGPIALKSHGIGSKKCITSYPGLKGQLEGDYNYKEEKVVVDGNLITSRGPGMCLDFALTIVEKIIDKEKAQEIAKGLLWHY